MTPVTTIAEACLYTRLHACPHKCLNTWVIDYHSGEEFTYFHIHMSPNMSKRTGDRLSQRRSVHTSLYICLMNLYAPPVSCKYLYTYLWACLDTCPYTGLCPQLLAMCIDMSTHISVCLFVHLSIHTCQYRQWIDYTSCHSIRRSMHVSVVHGWIYMSIHR